ncbi:Protein NRT1/ PTR FAMILY 5.10 [Rhynchospora pubera]|uniref:Protein NRT1/ PTR FAMILY 5.10 n=1 Tax=Rhynchospora pubera TaxID=906938 RepID=A0AAV8G182_9POAL|nr:Protein NRT1/ PTR FAMILY 5.10 [Rhynchospora pubera]
MESDPLLPGSDPLPGVVDYQGPPVSHSSSGRWRSALYIIGVEITERFAYYGVSSNLITYLTGPLHQSTAAAAASVNAWNGAASLLPLLGAFVADSWLGRYRTILVASCLYLLALVMLTLSSTLPFLQPPDCSGIMDPTACSVPVFQLIFFYFSLYLVAIAQSGHKPCVQAFGADQFDQNAPDELAERSSFFNWWYFGMCGGNIFTISILNYVQDNVGWGLGFGIPCMVMSIALIIFLAGTRTYRFYPIQKESPFTEVSKFIVALVRGHEKNNIIKQVNEAESSGLNYTKEAKELLKLFPIWATCLVYALVFAQWSTFFIKQAATLDRRIGPAFQVPPAALASFINVSVVIFLPIYDKVIVPLVRKITKTPSGITMLQRIGIGMMVSLLSMVIAALVEMKRLKTARDYGLVDEPGVPIPMSLWWIIPQYILVGMADVFTMVGLQEFFYDQVPDQWRSLGLSLYLSIFGIGSYISSFTVSLIDKITTENGDSWFTNNLNQGHLDYFYWLLAGLSAVAFLAYYFFAQAYVYKNKEEHVIDKFVEPRSIRS